MNNTNINNDIDIKCTHHPHQDIIFMCITCDNEPICKKCMLVNHQYHKLEDVDEIDSRIREMILSDFNNNTLTQLNKHIDDNKTKLNESNSKFRAILQQHHNNLESVIEQFKLLHNSLNIAENDIKLQLSIKLDESKQINTTIESTLNNINNNLNNIINNNNNNSYNIKQEENDDNNNNIINNLNSKTVTQLNLKQHSKNFEIIDRINTHIPTTTETNYNKEKRKLIDLKYDHNQFIQILKYKQQYKSIIINELPEYKDIIINVNKHCIDIINNTLDSIVKSTVLIKKQLKRIKYYEAEFTIYEDGCEIPENTQCLAIEHGHHLPPVFPDSVYWLLLPDGFDCQSLQSLPPTIKELDIFKIKYKLEPGSIPNSIIHLTFGQGFDQRVIKGIIPDSVKRLFLFDIIHPLDEDSIPDNVMGIYVSSKHLLIKAPKNSRILQTIGSKKYNY